MKKLLIIVFCAVAAAACKTADKAYEPDGQGGTEEGSPQRGYEICSIDRNKLSLPVRWY